DITHGVGLAILTPHWMRAVLSEETLPRFTALGTELFGLDPALPPMELAERTIDAVSSFLFETLGLPSTLREVGIDDTHLEEMAKNCNARLRLGFVPLTVEQTLAIYRAAL
ncbi:MAG: iron-containing alcohol dehydrogenase, partial [Firmicutes bacterium]|nr:iron-containing alcohol dehydrogenase [Bacillota bacterium]